jgi:5-dehydro-4-deoxyglucarate dehydratase
MFDGVLFFPVTAFDSSGALALGPFADHVSARVAAGPGGVFVACGTGEFHALAPEEYAAVVRCAVEVTAGRVPVFAGTGGPVGLAQSYARTAEAAGADGLLLLPPYLVSAPQAGLVAYARSVAAASDLPVILYSRDNAILDVAAAVELAGIPNVVGLKDGSGDIDRLSRVVDAVRAALSPVGKEFTFFNGLPTAEVTARAYRAIGIEHYSSAVYCFAPEISTAFYDALRAGDETLADLLLTDFFYPLVELRSRVPGFAVALVKAAVRLRGTDVGGVRPPLVDPSPAHLTELERILAAGLALVTEPRA